MLSVFSKVPQLVRHEDSSSSNLILEALLKPFLSSRSDIVKKDHEQRCWKKIGIDATAVAVAAADDDFI